MTIGTSEIVKSASFLLQGGESLAINGRSGSGKTTLLHCIAGLRTATQGSISLDGSEIGMLNERELTFHRRSIGFMFQTATLFEELDVIDNVSWVGRLRGLSRKDSIEASAELLERLNLIDRSHARTGELSGGEAQRVNLARSVVGNVRLLLADEPIAALDLQNSHEVCKLISEITSERKLCTILVSHDQLIEGYASRSMTMRAGVLGEANECHS